MLARFILLIIALSCFGCGASKSHVVKDNKNDFSYQEKYKNLFSEKKYDELHNHLQAWEKEEPNNPEMYIAYFNYYIFRNKSSNIAVLTEKPKQGQFFALTDSTGEVAGYMGEYVGYNNDDVLTGVKFLEKGLAIVPNRLDMHFGKIHALNEIENYEMAGAELYSTIELSKKINNEWLWSKNEKVEAAEKFFLENILDYYKKWLSIGSDESLSQLKKCTEKQIELYPENMFAYNFLAVQYIGKKQYQDALKIFLQAEKKNGNDCIILMNIALTYLEINDMPKVKEYLSKIMETCDESYKQAAQEYMDELE
jgi:tetratricopeptide (TPR) repeat protein